MSGFSRRYADALMVGAAIDASQAAQNAATANVADVLKGAGLLGMSGALPYAAGTVGAFLAGLGRSVAEVAAGVTPLLYAYPPLDIRRYGATAGGAVPCDAALTAAIKVAACFALPSSPAEYPAASVYVPPGDFLLVNNNPFGAVDFTTLPGASNARYYFGIRGDGQAARFIWRPTGATDAWLYDNGAAVSQNNRLILPCFDGIQVRLDVSGLSAGGTVNGFRCVGDAVGSAGVTQGLRFHKCKFVGAAYPATLADIAKTGTFIKLLGTLNASETLMVGCTIHGMRTALDIGTNNNAVNHTFVGTDIESMYGDVFKVAGGGCINVFGGSFSMMSHDAQRYLVAVRLTSAVLAGTLNFTGIRLELNQTLALGDFSNILLIDATGQPSAFADTKGLIAFHSCNFYPVSRATPGYTVNLDAATSMAVTFDTCDGLDGTKHQVQIFGSKAGLRNANANTGTRLSFINGTAPAFGAVVYNSTDSVGMVSARNCRNTLDYDLTVSGRYHTTAGRNLPRKTATIYGTAWPDAGNNATMQIRLPQRSELDAVEFRKCANAGAATAGYRLAIVDGTSRVYAQSAAAAQNTEHTASATNLRVLLDDTAVYSAGKVAAQDIYLLAVAGGLGSAQAVAMVPGDSARVHYY